MPGKRQRVVIWQMMLVLVPVLVLAGTGLMSLQRDRLAVRQEAEERARDSARNLAERINEKLARTIAVSPNAVEFRIGTNGTLIYPPPIPVLVPGPSDFGDFTATQQQLWSAARHQEFVNHDPTAAVAAYEKFLATDPPPSFHNLGLFAQANLLEHIDSNAAVRRWFSLTGQPLGNSESGVPLEPLVRFRLYVLSQRTALGEFLRHTNFYGAAYVAENLVTNPTLLSTRLLSEIERFEREPGPTSDAIAKWKQTWEHDQLARELHQHFALETAKDVFWIRASSNWLAALTWNGAAVGTVRCRAEGEIRRELSQMLADLTALPDYLGAIVELSGQPLNAGSVANRPDSSILASASPTNTSPGSLNVKLFLTNSDRLYRRHRTRMLWQGLLIGAAVLVASLGLLQTYYAFRRQERLQEAKTNFVSSVSHELRAPIASVRLLAESLERGKVVEKQAEYYQLIVQECRRLGALVNNVLDFSRIEQNRKSYEFDRTNLAELVRQTVALLEPYANDRGVHLKFDPASEPTLEIDADGRALQQALINLIDNAIKFSPSGEIVTVLLAAHNRSVVLSVKDRGQGILPEHRGRIFDPFFRGGCELRRETEGIGIGLVLVKHVVEAHGGSIHVTSEPGRGSCFAIELPRDRAVKVKKFAI